MLEETERYIIARRASAIAMRRLAELEHADGAPIDLAAALKACDGEIAECDQAIAARPLFEEAFSLIAALDDPQTTADLRRKVARLQYLRDEIEAL